MVITGGSDPPNPGSNPGRTFLFADFSCRYIFTVIFWHLTKTDVLQLCNIQYSALLREITNCDWVRAVTPSELVFSSQFLRRIHCGFGEWVSTWYRPSTHSRSFSCILSLCVLYCPLFNYIPSTSHRYISLLFLAPCDLVTPTHMIGPKSGARPFILSYDGFSRLPVLSFVRFRDRRPSKKERAKMGQSAGHSSATAKRSDALCGLLIDKLQYIYIRMLTPLVPIVFYCS